VHTLVTLGTPHGGTHAAHLLPVRLARQLRPGSDVLAELAAPVYLCRTRFVAVWSDLDQLIYPKPHARIDHPDLTARNVFLPGIGHMSLPIDRRVVHEVAHALTHLHADGSTEAAAVAEIDPGSGPALPEPRSDSDLDVDTARAATATHSDSRGDALRDIDTVTALLPRSRWRRRGPATRDTG
jgi:hypothetical protein